ncbi:hypothetical protein DFH29DRAFT_17916 [Suillus ampliporus]|nr:hypothetical protein DFH29DRAFT_17916 [Suillus ampliporus]
MSPHEGHTGGRPLSVSHEPDTGIEDPDGRLRSRIVEILASTSNGCLTELGYHPGMMEKLQRHTQHIRLLEGENAKLYQDNCQLSNVVRMHNERVAHLSANQSSQLQQFSTMQERLRALEAERNNLIRNNQDILISVSAGTSHHLLAQELDHMRSQSSRVFSDMQSLRIKYAQLSTQQRGQTSPGVLSPSNSVPQISQPRIPTPSDVHQRQVSGEGAPRLQPSRLSQQHTQQYARQTQQQVQHTVPSQQLQHTHQAPAQRRTSDVVTNPYPHRRSPPAPVRWKVAPTASAPPFFGTRSPTDTAHIPPPPISAPMNPNRQQQPPHTHPLTYPSQSGHPTAPAPVAPFNTHSKSNPLPPPSRPTLSIDLSKEDERMTEQQDRGGRLDQPSGLKRPNSAVDAAVAQVVEVVKKKLKTAPTPEDAIVNVEPEPKLASPDTVVGSKPTSPVSSSSPAPLAQEKIDTTSAAQVGVPNDEVAIAATPSDTVVGSNPTSPSSVTPPPAQEKMAGPPGGDNPAILPRLRQHDLRVRR